MKFLSFFLSVNPEEYPIHPKSRRIIFKVADFQVVIYTHYDYKQSEC